MKRDNTIKICPGIGSRVLISIPYNFHGKRIHYKIQDEFYNDPNNPIFKTLHGCYFLIENQFNIIRDVKKDPDFVLPNYVMTRVYGNYRINRCFFKNVNTEIPSLVLIRDEDSPYFNYNVKTIVGYDKEIWINSINELIYTFNNTLEIIYDRHKKSEIINIKDIKK